MRKQERMKNILTGKNRNNNDKDSLKNITYEWLDRRKPKWTERHYKDVERTLEKDVLPYLGHVPIESILPVDIVTAVLNVENRGSTASAKKILQRINAICRYAVQTGRLTYNPASEMQGVLENTGKKHMPAVFGQELGNLLQDITDSSNTHISTRLALKFTALTACRPGEVRLAKWRDINLSLKEWHIPSEVMKMRRPHIVPLSKQAIAVLERAAIIFGKTGYVFPSPRKTDKPLSDVAMSKALRSMGYKGKATPTWIPSFFFIYCL